MSRRGFPGQSPRAASRSGDTAARWKQSSSQVLPGTLPASEPWSQSRARGFSEDDTASPAHLAPQHLLSPGPSRMISATPPKQTFTPAPPAASQQSPSTLAKHQLPGKVPLGTAQSIPPAPTETPVHGAASPSKDRQGRSPSLRTHCPPGPGTQEPGHDFASKTWNALRTRSALAPWVRPGKSRKQRQKCHQLQLETQLHPNSKALFAAGSVPPWLRVSMEKCYLFKVGDLSSARRRGHSKLAALTHPVLGILWKERERGSHCFEARGRATLGCPGAAPAHTH